MSKPLIFASIVEILIGAFFVCVGGSDIQLGAGLIMIMLGVNNFFTQK